MSKHASYPTLTINIDSALASRYRDAYQLALGSSYEVKQTIDEFIAEFVEDRLAEEISFFEDEVASDSR